MESRSAATTHWTLWTRLTWRFRRRRKYVVSIESPSRLTGFPHEVKARDEDEALRKAKYWWFQNCYAKDPWYRWHYEVLDA